jgi:peptide/nickel transport system ATP-binding protein
MAEVLEADHLRAYYTTGSKDIKAVDGVSFRVRKGEIFGIAGESGCGKTTLIKLLYAIARPPLRILQGDVFYEVGGKRIRAYSREMESLRWRFASYVPQGSMSALNPTSRIKKEFHDVMGAHMRDAEERERTAIEHLRSLDLPADVMERYPHQLSGGMKQRVTIALATVLRPDIIFADEPTTALDVVVQMVVISMLKEIQEEMKNTIVLVTHDMGVHAEMDDRIAVMYAGRIVEIASVYEIFGEPMHPYTNFLIKSLPRIGDKSGRASAPGTPPSLSALPEGCTFNPRCPYARDVCRRETPELMETSKEHWVSCFMAQGDERWT